MVEDTVVTPTQEEPAAIREDQAEGLRSMFSPAAPRMICMACALDADTAATMTLGTAHALRQQGQRVLLIDEVPLQDRRSMTGLAYKMRYDIAQVMENDIQVPQAIRQVEENMWFATGLRMARSYSNRKIRHPSLMERLAKTHFEFDEILLATTKPIEGVLRAYAKDMLHLVVCAPEDASLIHALEFIRAISTRSDAARIPVVIVGGASETEGKEAFDRLESASKTLMDQPLELTGWIPAVTIPYARDKSMDPAGLILPATLYAKLAGTAMRLEPPV
jgi:MinD-like ATPase involved in chromosome partitioning or flagellar assembly